jgi:outer membrane protein
MTWRAFHLGLATTLAAVPSVRRASAAEPSATGSMSLASALAYARAHQPELRAAAARVEAVKSQGEITRSRWYPTVAGTAQLLATTTNNTTGSYVSVPTFDNPRVSATRAESPSTASLVPAPSTLVGAGLRQEIFDFGRITAEAAADDLRTDAERLSYQTTRLLVDYDVEETYFAVYAAKSVLQAADQAYARAAVHRDLAKAGVESGLRRPIDLTRAEATLDHYDLERIRARRGVAVAQTVLAAAVGVPQPRLDIAGAPPAPPELPSLDKAFATALDRNPELLAALVSIKAQERETRAIGARLHPELFLTSALSGNAGGATPSSGESAPAQGLVPIVPNWDVGLVLSWPLFDATTSAREKQSRQEEEVRRAEESSVRLKLESQVEQAYLDVQAAREALPALQHSTNAAIANYDQASARFNVGMGDAVELADAEELRTSTEIQLAIGVFDLARTRAELGRVIAEEL